MDYRKELQEAINAADEALVYLRRADERLGKARTWGMLDMFGGELLTTLMKHNRMNEAQRDMDQAKFALQRFQKELQDVDQVVELNIDVGEFVTFADFLFDGLFVDWYVQSKIADARRQLAAAIWKVQTIRDRLVDQLQHLQING